MVNPRMPREHTISLGQTAEVVARRLQISREEQDRFALESHRRAVAAQEACRFQTELVPVPREGAETVLYDEGPRRDTSMERLAGLKPAFEAQGTVTAGNSSPLSDGAACLLLTSAGRARALGYTPLARVVSAAAAGVEPAVMGLGPIPASRKALARAAIRTSDLEVVEINEAFASQAIACLRGLELDPERVNPNGGAIALGHPLGASGARILTTLVHELVRRGGGYGLATMCIGVGQGIAVVVESPA
jgi:acetyl-CoA acetyltransferase family protein